MSGADVGTGGKAPPVEVTLNCLNEDLSQTDIRGGLSDFLAAIQWMKQTFESNISINVLDSPGEQGFWMANGKLRQVAAVQVLLRSGLVATVLEFACSDDHAISTLIVGNSLSVDETRAILPSLLSHEGGWDRSALDCQWEARYHLLRHLPRSPQRWAGLLHHWVRILG